MNRTLPWAAAAALALAVPLASAATIYSNATQIADNKWSVEFNVVNDGSPAFITGLTVYFPQASFADLLLYRSPSGWDSLAISPDTALPAAGFFDTFVLDPLNGLGAGQSQGGFEIRFTYLGAGSPGAFAFDINDPAYNVLFSGMTVAVPEPTSALMALFGLGAIGAYRARRTKADAAEQNQMETFA